MGCKIEINKVKVLVVTLFIVCAFTPIVLAATTDSLRITFDPDGAIDIDVNNASYNFGSIQANEWSNTTGGYFTLYNNGTIAMDTQIYTNASTESTEMDLNASGVAPGPDEYAIYISGFDVENYLTIAPGVVLDTGLLPADSKTFDVCLLIGVNLSLNFTAQNTTIYFQGTPSS